MACARCLAQAEEGGLWIRSLHKAVGRGGLEQTWEGRTLR